MSLIPRLGGAGRAVRRNNIHCLLKSASASNTTTLNVVDKNTPLDKGHHGEEGSNVYQHKWSHKHHAMGHGKQMPKPISQYGYRYNRMPLLSSANRSALNAPALLNHIRRYSTTAGADKKRVAVVLSGCGVLDGSEIHEAVSVLVHLSRAGVEAKMFAPDIAQSDVVNHVKGSPTGDEKRNVLVESARIARGKVKPLSSLQADKFDAVVFPGGYGAAKNLCNFAEQGENLTVQQDVQRIIKEFHEAKKPIGMLCVSPVIAAKLIPGVSVTLGNEDKDIQGVIEKLGAKSVPLGVNEVAIDNENNVVSSPAYMTNSPIHKVYDGIGKFTEVLLSRIGQPAEQKEAKS